LRINIKAYGPEIASLISREKIIDIDPGSTVKDLISKLEEEIKPFRGRSIKYPESPFTILVNGRPLESFRDTLLNEGDVVTILSPIGGG
jgi:sulfur carrier protein ThiS